MILNTQGWAVVDPDGINIKTVSDTRRAAIVNWLVVEKGIGMFASTNDAQIELAWCNARGPSEVMEVTVTKHIQ